MIKVIDLCTGCVQVITNPICPNCFSNQILIWLRDKNLSANKVSQIKKLLRKLVTEAEETSSDTKCILCGFNKVNLCVYCFTNKAKKIIESKADTNTIEDFNEDFNTAIWRI